MSFPLDAQRFKQLSSEIEKIFGHLAPDEIDIIAADFDHSTMRMIEVIDTNSRCAVIMDLYEDFEFRPVLFPTSILPLLRRHDVFLSTLGFRKGRWYALYMSPPYQTSTDYKY